MSTNGTVLSPKFGIPEILCIERRKIRAFADQPRTYFDPIALAQLAESIEQDGQATPAIAIRLDPSIGDFEYELVDGERRWRACEMKSITEFLILIHPNIKTKDDQYVRSVMANYFNVPPTDVECAHSIDRMRKMGMTNEAIAKKMGKSTTWVYQHHSLLRLDPHILTLIGPAAPKDQQIPYLNALELVELPREDQLRHAHTMSTEKVTRAGTKLLVRQSAISRGIIQKLKLPKKAFTEIKAIVKGTNDKVELVLDQPAAFFDQVVKGASTIELKHLITKFGDLISGLQMLKEEIVKSRDK